MVVSVKKQGGGANPAPKIDHVRITVYSTAALPVELVNFGLDSDFDGVKLLWATASERENEKFRIQRSRDLQHWATIGEVKGAGTSNHNIKYSWIDRDPPLSLVYYRLEQVDFDGSTEKSQIISSLVSKNSQGMGKLWSNSEGIHLRCSDLGFEPTHLVLTSMNGKKVRLDHIRSAESSIFFDWAGQRPASGIYFYQVFNGNVEGETGKFLLAP